jgi:hypothetical protein
MVFLPKYELRLTGELLKSRGLAFFETEPGRLAWETLQTRINQILLRHCTTLALAQYVLETSAVIKNQSWSAGTQIPAGLLPADRPVPSHA